jgi:hypothetical protein
MTTRKKLWLRMVENKTVIVWFLQEYIIAFVGRFFGTPIQMEFMVGLRRSMGKRGVASGSCAILRVVIDKRNCYD